MFELAKNNDKPIFLYLGAVWCMNCHIFENTVLSNPLIAEYINEHFIPVRVDADERPDIVERYMVRGLPTFSFLMPDGKVIVQGNNIPLNVFRKNMRMIISLYETKREKILSAIAGRETIKKQTELNKEEIGHRLVADVDSLLSKEFDKKHGGFGDKEKFPLPYNLEFEMFQYYITGQQTYLDRVTKTLKGILHGLQDPIEGGFYRYSISPDWKKPHYEKMLQVNARIIDVFLDGYQITGNTQFKDTIKKGLGYLERTLYDKELGLYYSSQDAEDGKYYQLSKKERQRSVSPNVDQRQFADQNAQMVLTLTKAYGVLQEQEYLTRSISVFEKLKDNFFEKEGLMSHTSGGNKRFLNDQLLVGLAAVRLYEFTGENFYLTFAEQLVEKIRTILWDNETYGFFSFPPDTSLALHKLKIKSIEGNAHAIELSWRLYHLTGKQLFYETMKNTLTAFPEVFTGVEYLENVAVPKLAIVVEKSLRPPVEIKLVKGAAYDKINDMLLKVLRHYGPMKIIEILDHDEDKVRLETLGYPLRKINMAYFCVSEFCISTGSDKIEGAIETINQVIKPGY